MVRRENGELVGTKKISLYAKRFFVRVGNCV